MYSEYLFILLSNTDIPATRFQFSFHNLTKEFFCDGKCEVQQITGDVIFFDP